MTKTFIYFCYSRQIKTSQNSGILPYMELRSTFRACFLLFLLLVLPYFSKGGSEVVDSEVYEIDYRGPETHSSTPPPHDSHPNTHPKNLLPPPKAKRPFMPSDQKQQKVKKIRG